MTRYRLIVWQVFLFLASGCWVFYVSKSEAPELNIIPGTGIVCTTHRSGSKTIVNVAIDTAWLKANYKLLEDQK